MKYFIKGNAPEEFIIWRNLKNKDWTPTYDSLSGVEKLAVYKALKQEQGYICCYCERSLEENDYHIEHLKPQHLENVDPLDFANMMCSCQKRLDKGEPRHCGNSKNGWYDEELLISPLTPICEDKFKYTYDGYIEPAETNDTAAITTLKILQLQIDKLNALRRKAIEPFLDDLSSEEIENFTIGYLIDKEKNNGKFNMFYTTIKYLFS